MLDWYSENADFDSIVALRKHCILVAAGKERADLVLKNATYVNVFSGELTTEDIAIADGYIVGVGSYHGIEEHDMTGKIVCPGFFDSHVHLESSLVSPAEFARAVLPHGTTTVVTDPHEIANVMGADGIAYMLAATENLPIDVYFMVPSCVPATPLDESGATLNHLDIEPFLSNPRVRGLAEMMNFPGVINGDNDPVSKIVMAQKYHKKIDGHAPCLLGKDLSAYISGGVYSDHECFSAEDAMLKLRRGQYVMIREGTAAKNLEALMPLVLDNENYRRCMFCTDDEHPNDVIISGHIDHICRRAVQMGANPIHVVQIACYHAAEYYQMNNRGAIGPGYLADITVVKDLKDFRVTDVYKLGKRVYGNGQVVPFAPPVIPEDLRRKALDTFHMPRVTPEQLKGKANMPVIGMLPGQIVTEAQGRADGIDPEKGILKIAVIERHKATGHIGLSYLTGYGLKSGAVATSVSHDSHNIICVGSNEEDMALAANYIADQGGGIVVTNGGNILAFVPLEIAGLMSDQDLRDMNTVLQKAKNAAYGLGVIRGVDPFMTLSFTALSVIPVLRLTTRGVFNVDTQTFIE